MNKTIYSNKRNATRKKIDRVFIENFRLPGSADLYLDDPDVVIGEIMEFNRENGYLPMLLLSASNNSRFLYLISDAAIEMLAGGRDLTDDIREKLSMLYTYHFAGISMLIRRMRENVSPCDEGYADMAQKMIELIRPVVYHGLLVITEHIKDPH